LLRNLSEGTAGGELLFEVQITIWLWFTVLFANFAEAMAEGRGKAQGDTLKRGRKETKARRLLSEGQEETVSAASLHKNDIVLVNAQEVIPSDGEVVQGVTTVDESAITGELPTMHSIRRICVSASASVSFTARKISIANIL
jgi:K+-transporting ATPase ATPase B chain